MMTVAGFLNVQRLLIVPEMNEYSHRNGNYPRDCDNPSYGDHPGDCDTPKIRLATLQDVA